MGKSRSPGVGRMRADRFGLSRRVSSASRARRCGQWVDRSPAARTTLGERDQGDELRDMGPVHDHHAHHVLEGRLAVVQDVGVGERQEAMGP